MDRQPATFDEAAAAVAAADHRSEVRIVADAIHAAAYLIPGRLLGRLNREPLRRAVAARLARDSLALLHLAGGTARDVVDAACATELYGRPDDDPRTVADRASAYAAGRAAARPDPFRDPAFLDAEHTDDD